MRLINSFNINSILNCSGYFVQRSIANYATLGSGSTLFVSLLTFI